MPKAKKKPEKKRDSPTIIPAKLRDEEVSITIQGSARAVKHLLHTMQFGEWNPDVTRQIAIDQTFTDGADVDDELAGPKLKMKGPDDRTAYRDRCILEAEDRGHLVSDPKKIPNKETTTVGQVGDALFKYSS